MTPEEELAQVDAAISRILAGGVQEFGEGAHRVRHISYGELVQRRDELRNIIAQQNAPRIITVSEVRHDFC